MVRFEGRGEESGVSGDLEFGESGFAFGVGVGRFEMRLKYWGIVKNFIGDEIWLGLSVVPKLGRGVGW